MDNKNQKDPTRFLSACILVLLSDFIATSVKLNKLKADEVAIIAFIAAESTRPIISSLYYSNNFGFEFKALPEDERVPVKSKLICKRIGINRETLRRRLNSLTERGLIIKVAGGYIFPEQVGDNDYTLELRNLVTRRFYEISKHVERVKAIQGSDDGYG